MQSSTDGGVTAAVGHCQSHSMTDNERCLFIANVQYTTLLQ